MPTLLKLTFIPGLLDIVMDELAHYPDLRVVTVTDDSVYLEPVQNFNHVTQLRSIGSVHVVRRGPDLNPYFISRHKSQLGELVASVLGHNPKFTTFTISCAGSDSDAVVAIEQYLRETYKLKPSDDADLKISIGKSGDIWEMGVQATARPLSLRNYKVVNMKGALNPTIAYAMNVLANVTSAQSYLNVCSGSGTLLIEAGLMNPNLTLAGFDSDGKHNAMAVENAKQAGLIKRIKLTTADLMDQPDMGTFDIIVSDLPFGMLVSPDANLAALYRGFADYCETAINPGGTVVAYTTEHELLISQFKDSRFEIVKTLDLVVSTNTGAYLYPRIVVAKLRA